jgi:hypothetical protein
MLTKNCVNCNNTFVAKGKKKACSKKCNFSYWYKNNKRRKLDTDKMWRDKNPNKVHGIKLRQYYKIEFEDYDRLNKEQGGICKICNQTCSSGRKLSVDHCHKTGKIRGLLCTRCNKGLGSFKDNINLLNSAIIYLEKSK